MLQSVRSIWFLPITYITRLELMTFTNWSYSRSLMMSNIHAATASLDPLTWLQRLACKLINADFHLLLIHIPSSSSLFVIRLMYWDTIKWFWHICRCVTLYFRARVVYVALVAVISCAETHIVCRQGPTCSMVLSPSWEANWFAASQEVPRVYEFHFWPWKWSIFVFI